MALRLILITLIWMLSLGCASVHPGKEVKSSSPIEGLKLSAETQNKQEGEAHLIVTFTFENEGDDWLRIEGAEIVIDEGAAQYVGVIEGDDLRDWTMAMEARLQLDQQNKQVTQATLAALGGAAMAIGAAQSNSRDRQNLMLLGVGTYTAVGAWAISDAITSSRKSAENPNFTPDNYMTTSFSIPGKLFVRKWVLLRKPSNQKITVMPVKIITQDGREATYTVRL